MLYSSSLKGEGIMMLLNVLFIKLNIVELKWKSRYEEDFTEEAFKKRFLGILEELEA